MELSFYSTILYKLLFIQPMIQKKGILDDITTLYELSLAIGSSLDLYENCECFLSTLLSRKNLDFASVWVKKEMIQVNQIATNIYENVFALPLSKSNIEEVEDSHPILSWLENKPFVSHDISQPRFHDCIQEFNITKGVYAIYKLGDMGFLKLYSSQWKEALTNTELNKLLTVVRKFTVSLEGCISHQRSIIEARSRIKMEQQLREKDILFSSVIEELQEGLLITTPETDIIFANPRMEQLSGYQISEMIHKKAYELFFAKEKWPTLKQKVAQRKTGVPDKYEIEQTRRDGSLWWSQINATPYYDESGNQIGIIALITDVTHQKRADDQLKKSEQDHRLLFNQNPHPMLIFATDSLQILAVNDTTADKYGYTKEELQQMTIKDLQPVEEIPHLMKKLNNDREVSRAIHQLKDGNLINVDVTTRNITYDNQMARLVLIQDITARLEAEQELRMTYSRLQALLQNMQAGILLEDTHRKIVLVNPAFCQMFDIPTNPEELIGLDCVPFAELRKGFFKTSETFISQIQDILVARNIILSEELELTDGRILERDYIPVFNGDQYLGHLWQYRDVSNKKRAEKVLIKAREKAEESSQAKERFLANMSHEIRTPLNAIMGMQSLLKKTTLSGKQKKYIDAIGVSANNLLVIINDILDISKIEAGKLELERVDYDLTKLIRHLIFTLSYKAEEKGIGLFAEIEPDIHPVVKGDSVRMNQILLNLVNNAIKFTDVGKVRVKVEQLSATETTQMIRFQVIDTGKGIKQENLEAIFKSFSQEDASITRKFGGTGLGLAIGKQLVELFGGCLEVKSEYGKGTVFFFTIPFEKGSQQAIPSVREVNGDNTKALFEKRVLLAEDNQMNQFLATTILEDWGVLVEVAENGKEAIEMFSEGKYDLILMDMQMPIMDGLEATRIIRKRLHSKIPIIALTANAIKGDKQRCLDAGMDDYLTKPFVQRDLLEKMIINLDLPILLTQPTPEKTEAMEEEVSLSTPKVYDLTKLKKMMGGNREQVSDMLTMFVQDTPALVKDMNLAFAQRDIQTVGKLAHKIKSSLDILDIHCLTKTVRKIEHIAKEQPETPELDEVIKDFTEKIVQVLQLVSVDPLITN